MTRLSAHVTLRAVKDALEPLDGETRSEMAARELDHLGREIAEFLAVTGWEFAVTEVRESECCHVDALGRCPCRATDVVDGDDLCGWHAFARRHFATLGMTA